MLQFDWLFHYSGNFTSTVCVANQTPSAAPAASGYARIEHVSLIEASYITVHCYNILVINTCPQPSLYCDRTITQNDSDSEELLTVSYCHVPWCINPLHSIYSIKLCFILYIWINET